MVHHFRNEKRTGAEICPEVVSGIDTGGGGGGGGVGQLLGSFFSRPG